MKFRFLILSVALLCCLPVWAQQPADTALTFGNKMSVSSIAAALQTAGFQALVSRPPNAPDALLGVVATGINGAKMNIFAFKCDNSKTDEICSLSFMVSYTDDKNLLSDALLASINLKVVLVRVTRSVRTTDNKSMMNVAYTYPVKDVEDTKFIVPVMSSFAQDIGRVLTTYNAVANPPAAPAPQAK